MKSHSSAPATPGEPSDETLRAWLSDLADGEADGACAQGACQAWRDRADMRQTWHTYHLIGDALRSDELARPQGRDAAFLARLRERLADEPVVLAPMPERPPLAPATTTAVPARRRQAWLAPAAAAAGFVAVAGVLVVTRLSGPTGDPRDNAALQARSASGLSLASGAAAPAAAGVGSSGAAMIRDARLDAYLQAHQAVRGGGAAAVPGVSLRSVDAAVAAGAGR